MILIVLYFRMPKSNKEIINDNNQYTSTNTALKRQKKSVFKFDIQKILKERQLEGRLLKISAKLDEEMKIIDALYQEKVNQTFDIEDNEQNSLVSSKSDTVIIDRSNYNIFFKDFSDSDLTESCIERLQIMSIEENELEANIHFNHLMKANWSPVFDVCFEKNKFYSCCLINKYLQFTFLVQGYLIIF